MAKPQKQNRFLSWYNKQPITIRAVYLTSLFGLITALIVLFLDKTISKPDVVLLATPISTPTQISNHDYRVGIIPGHQETDIGEVCSDGLTEREVNKSIADSVKRFLVKDGYSAQVFSDFDQRLIDYQALVAIVIHTDSCQYINDYATGFKLAPAFRQADKEIAQKTEQLIECLKIEYESKTKLAFHKGSQTLDMTIYNSFGEISKVTPIVIMDAGFLNLDRDLLTQQTDLIAEGISNGLQCFFRSENVALLDTAISLIYPRDSQNEYIQIQNLSPTTLSLMGWTLQDDYGNIFTFPNISAESNNSIRVYTQKKGVNSGSELFWEISSMEWKSNDRIVLKDSSGVFRNAERVP